MYLLTNLDPSHVYLAYVIYCTLGSTGYKRVCYYTNWSQYRPGDGKFLPEDVDPSLCSHVIYAFASMSGNRLTPYEWNDENTDWSTGM